jgi:hypothetical protein
MTLLPRLLLPLGLVLVVAGCDALPGHTTSRVSKAQFVPTNQVAEAIMPARLRRLILMPVAGGSEATPESCAVIDAVVVEALQHENRFEIVHLTREECQTHFQVEELSSVMPLPANFMAVLRRDYAADGVLFVDLTVYRAYQPLSIGLRAKLAMIDDAHLVWSFDNLYSADDPAVAASATRYLQARETVMLPPDLTTVILQSPDRFASYAVASMFDTLPPVRGRQKAAVAAVQEGRKEAKAH